MSFTVVKDSYPNIVKDGLVLNVDAGSRLSYSGSGTTWNDISGNGNNGTLVNGPTYSSANSGSIVFDGTNDYVTAPLSSQFEFGTGEFAVEAWVNLTSTTTINSRILGIGDGANGSPAVYTGWSFLIQNLSGIIYLTFLRYDGASTTYQAVIPSFSTGQWFHFVVTRNASNTLTLYSNGVAISTTASVTQSYNSVNSEPLFLGRQYDGASPFGYKYANFRVSNARIYKGKSLTAAEVLQNYNALLPRYYSIVTSGLVLNLDAGNPNSYSPPRSDQYASSLVLAVPMNGANNGTTFTDQSATIRGSGTAKAITRNGSTQTLTAQSKFYGSSGFFDATGDSLTFAASSDFAFGTGDFTIEFWMNSNDVSSAQRGFFQISSTAGGLQTSYVNSVIIAQGGNASGANLNGGLVAVIDNVFFGSNTPVLSTGTWFHIALTRSGTSLRLFVNGNLHASGTSTANLTCQNLVVGGYYNSSYLYNGYLQDFRVYNGVAKYTTNFKPPSISSGVTISSASGGVPILNTTDDYGTVNGSSGTTWSDISGSGNTGTLTNGPTYNGANYGSIVFDGSNDYVSTGPSSNLAFGSGNFTISSWIYPNIITFNLIASSRVVSSASNLYWNFSIENGQLIFQSRTSGGTQYKALSNSSAISTNQWYNVAAVRLSNVITVYINGIAGPTTVNDGGNNLTEQYIGLGIFNYPGFVSYYSGNIANFSFYNTALTSAEVSQNFNATKWRYGI